MILVQFNNKDLRDRLFNHKYAYDFLNKDVIDMVSLEGIEIITLNKKLHNIIDPYKLNLLLDIIKYDLRGSYFYSAVVDDILQIKSENGSLTINGHSVCCAKGEYDFFTEEEMLNVPGIYNYMEREKENFKNKADLYIALTEPSSLIFSK